MKHLLDNIFWHSLTGEHARYASGSGGVRRYANGFSPLLGFENLTNPDLLTLAALCEPGETFYCADWSGPVPEGWALEAEGRMVQMTWAGTMPAEPEGLEFVRLGGEHAPQALELGLLMKPGPFGPRTIELGEYFGCFEGTRLMAMAGERSFAPPWREISGVCTHPDFQGRGLARQLMLKLIRRQLQRGETPFLHVMSGNEAARGLYRRMGFEENREAVVRVIARR